MAEEERVWSQRHAHESTTVTYGQFGTPTYDESSRTWAFLRQQNSAEADEEGSTAQSHEQPLLKILTDPENVVRAANSGVDIQDNHSKPENLAEITPAAQLIKAINKAAAVQTSNTHKDDLIAFGSALWLSADEVESGNLTSPLVAYATGTTTDTLRLACLGKQEIEYAVEDNIRRKSRVPSLVGDPQVSYAGIEPILQVSFSLRTTEGHGDTFLLVRRPSYTTIFEPLLHRSTSAGSSVHRQSSLDPNPLVTIDASVTGGCPHVNATFHPLDHRRIGIVDEEGNWSTWKIHGQRSATARVLYHARLKSSGRIFSWKSSKRPEGVGLFLDGWHKLLWMSSGGERVDRLLVCNRRTIKIFDTAGEVVCSVDPRLDAGKSSYVLDVQAGPTVNLCLVLTTSRLLLFDIAKQEWKDPTSSKGPALICASQHFHDPTDLSLRATSVWLGDQILLGLYSPASERLDLRQLSLSKKNDTVSVTVSDNRLLTLPVTHSRSQITSIVLSRSETVHTGAHSIPPGHELLCVIVRHEDSSVYSYWAMATGASQSGGEDVNLSLLKLPPGRSVHLKSARYIDDIVDDVEDEEFIASGVEGDMVWQPRSTVARPDPMTALSRVKEMKNKHMLIEAIQQQNSVAVTRSTLNVREAFESFAKRLQDSEDSDETLLDCTLLSGLVTENVKIKEIEVESDTLQQAISGPDRDRTGWTISRCHGRSTQTLLSTYRSVFNNFVDSLPVDVPDRFRVRKERQDRKIALEQYLCSYTAYTVPQEMEPALTENMEAMNSLQTIFSDPIQDEITPRQRTQPVSASQPLPQANSGIKKSHTVISPLVGSLARLRPYTKISRDLQETYSIDSATMDHFLSVLTHLPTSCEINPEQYDYADTLFSVAAKGAKTNGEDVQTGGRAQRRADKLARARRRAEASSPVVHFVSSGDIDKVHGNNSRDAESFGQARSDRNKGPLPIRGSESRMVQSQHGHALSDGHMPVESSSQAAAHDGLTLTQPERGTFANRAEVNSQGKMKKKKRVAGF